MKNQRVYIAGPYTKGDPARNVRAALDAAEFLLQQGYAPYTPHLTHFHHLIYPHDYETWMQLDFQFLPCCAAVFRLLGESSGADRECALARQLGIPVFTSLDDLDGHFHLNPPLQVDVGKESGA